MKGSVAEMPIETLLELEPVLLERHLGTLKNSDKEVFMEKYQVLGTEMKKAALTQMLGKYPDIAQAAAQQEGSFQNGGSPNNTNQEKPYVSPLGNLPTYGAETQGTTDVQPRPLQNPNYNAMFLGFATGASNEANTMDKQGNFSGADTLRGQILDANSERQTQEALGPYPRLYKNGGLTKAKAKEMLHDGTVHGEPITEKQRHYFAAIAFGKKKRMQDGGQINAESIKSSDKDKIKAVQADLKAKGLYTGKIDGLYGPLTDRAIKGYNKPAAQVSKEAANSKYQPTVSESRKGNQTATRRPTEAEMQAQLDAGGVNSDRTSGQFLPDFLNKRLYDNVLPAGYEGATVRGISAVAGIKDPRVENTKNADGTRADSWKDRYDAWALYMGQPQKDNSYKISEHRPEKNAGDGYYYDFNNIPEKRKQQLVTDYLSHGKGKKRLVSDDTEDGGMGSMGTFTTQKGKDAKGDYISYYDKWDLAGSAGIGKPLDIYGRIYYDPKTAKVKKQSGGSTDTGWKYEAPPTEGFHLAGIESNRPQSNVANLPAQGTGKGKAGPIKKSSAKTQDISTSEEEAFWAREQVRNAARTGSVPAYPGAGFTDAEFKDYLRNKVKSGANSIQEYRQMKQQGEVAKSAQQQGQYSWADGSGSPYVPNTIAALQKPQWLANSRPMQHQVSNTTRAIAATSADPMWDKIMFSTAERPIQQGTAQAGGGDEYTKWKSYKKFSMDAVETFNTDKMQTVKTFRNGDTLLELKDTDRTGKPVTLYSVRDGRTGKYALVDPGNKAEMAALNSAR